MAKRPDITTVTSGYTSQDTINTNFENVRDQFDNTISRDGSTPNTMNADFDLNDNDLLNAKDIDANTLTLNGVVVNPGDATNLDAAAVKTAYESNANTNAFEDADESKLDDIATPYNNYADFIASSDTFTDGEYAYTKEEGFSYKAVSSDADVTNAGTQGFQVQQGQSGYNVKAFGALGDGTTDDSAAIQQVLDRLNSNSGTVWFPTGNYVLESGVFSNAANTKNIKILGSGKAKLMWKAASGGVLLDLRRWTNECELSGFIFENTDQVSGSTAVRMTCWTGTGSDQSGTVDMSWLHDLVIGQPGDLGFDVGLRMGDETAYGTGEFFTYVQIDRVFFRHCGDGILVDATTFDLCQINNFNANGGGSSSFGADANSINHLRAITNIDKLLIHGFNVNRCTGYAIDLIGGGLELDGGWFEDCGGGLKMTSSGTAREVAIRNTKFTEFVGSASNNNRSIHYEASGPIALTGNNFDTQDVFISAEQIAVTDKANVFENGATFQRNDNRFKRVYNPRPLGQAAPHWEELELNYTDFNSASSSVTFDIPQTLPTGTIIHRVVARVETGFTGGSATASTLDFGISTDATGFFTGANAFNTGANRITDNDDQGSLLWNGSWPLDYYMTGTRTLRVTLNVTGDTGDNLTAGQVFIRFLVSHIGASESYYPEVSS